MADALQGLGTGIAGRIREGEGDTVLWLHGYTLDSSSWREMWDRLPGWRHVGVDLPGHGGSEGIPAGQDLAGLAATLLEVCEKEQVRHLVALSFGTLTATQLAIDTPRPFRSVTLGAPSLAGGPTDDEIGEAYADLFRIYFTQGTGPALVDSWMSCVAWEGIDGDPALHAELRSIIGRHSWSELRSQGMMAYLTPHHTPEALGRIASPMMVLVGDQERAAFVESARILARDVPECRIVHLPDTHHLCMLESPEPAARAVFEHLNANAEASPLTGDAALNQQESR